MQRGTQWAIGVGTGVVILGGLGILWVRRRQAATPSSPNTTSTTGASASTTAESSTSGLTVLFSGVTTIPVGTAPQLGPTFTLPVGTTAILWLDDLDLPLTNSTSYSVWKLTGANQFTLPHQDLVYGTTWASGAHWVGIGQAPWTTGQPLTPSSGSITLAVSHTTAGFSGWAAAGHLTTPFTSLIPIGTLQPSGDTFTAQGQNTGRSAQPLTATVTLALWSATP